MADTSNEPFVDFTIPALVERYTRASAISLRVCVHEVLDTAAAGEGDVDLTLRYDPVLAPLGPDPQKQRFEPLPMSPLVFTDGAEPWTVIGETQSPALGEVEITQEPRRPALGEVVITQEPRQSALGEVVITSEQPRPALGEVEITQEPRRPALGEVVITQEPRQSALGEVVITQEPRQSALGEVVITSEQPRPALGEVVITSEQPRPALGEVVTTQEPRRPALGEVVTTQEPRRPALGDVATTQEPRRPALGDVATTQEPRRPALGDVVTTQEPRRPALGDVATTQEPRRPALGDVAITSEQPRPLFGAETPAYPKLGEPSSVSVIPQISDAQDFWFSPREAQEAATKSMLATANSAIAVVFDASLDLTDIPIIGGKLPPELSIGLRGLALVWTPAGTALRPELWLFGAPFRLPLVMLPSQDTFGDNAPAKNQSPSSIRPVFWGNVDSTLGPLQLHRLGLGFKDEKLWLLMDTSLQMGPVKLTAIGLGMGIDLAKLLGGELTLPAFQIDGLGVEVRTSGGMTAGGALLRRTNTTTVNGQIVEYDVYAGAMIIQTKKMTISALGNFQMPPGGSPSLFAYGTLHKPLGGPPFFFVTRASVGFGVNMSFELPEVDRAYEFPLVRDVKSPNLVTTPNLSDLIRVADDLRDYQRSAPGTVVLAMGIEATSFGVINTSLVLLATISNSFRIDLIGQSVMQLPAEAGKQRIADVRIGWRGKWSPDADKISILGQVRRGSWAFHSAFQLTGQMAFEAWTQGPHAGDFVFTIGGYHPSYNVPQHYPQASRLAMGWSESIGKLTLSVKAEGYCAITPNALMLGGSLNYSISCGDFDAWYSLQADFLLQWYPFRYLAKLSLEIGASYTLDVGLFSVDFEVSVGADVELWGPDLGGKVTFKLVFIDVSFEFGASNVDSPPLDWSGFRQNFLAKEPLALRAKSGIRGQIEKASKTTWIVAPDELAIEFESAIPAMSLTKETTSFSGSSFGVRPMNVDAVTKSSIEIKVLDANGKPVHCVATASTRNMPAAQWGASSVKKTLVPDLLAGAAIADFGDPFTPESFSTLVERDEMINWDTHPQGPRAWDNDLGALDAPPSNYETNWTAPSAQRTALLREMLDVGSDKPDPLTERRSFWIAELQETPTQKTKKLVAS